MDDIYSKLDKWLEEEKKEEKIKEEKREEVKVEKEADYEEAKHIFSKYDDFDIEIKNWQEVNNLVKRMIKLMKFIDLIMYASCGEEKNNKLEKLYNIYRMGCACFKIDEIYAELGIDEDQLEDKLSKLIVKFGSEK